MIKQAFIAIFSVVLFVISPMAIAENHPCNRLEMSLEVGGELINGGDRAQLTSYKLFCTGEQVLSIARKKNTQSEKKGLVQLKLSRQGWSDQKVAVSPHTKVFSLVKQTSTSKMVISVKIQGCDIQTKQKSSLLTIEPRYDPGLSPSIFVIMEKNGTEFYRWRQGVPFFSDHTSNAIEVIQRTYFSDSGEVFEHSVNATKVIVSGKPVFQLRKLDDHYWIGKVQSASTLLSVNTDKVGDESYQLIVITPEIEIAAAAGGDDDIAKYEITKLSSKDYLFFFGNNPHDSLRFSIFTKKKYATKINDTVWDFSYGYIDGLDRPGYPLPQQGERR